MNILFHYEYFILPLKVMPACTSRLYALFHFVSGQLLESERGIEVDCDDAQFYLVLYER